MSNTKQKTDESLEKIKEISETLNELNTQARKSATEFLSKVLSENENNSVDLKHYDDEGFCNDDELLYVSYDGGSHPERDSDCFAEVERIYLDEGEIYLELTEYGDYNTNNLSINDLLSVVAFVANELDYKF